MQTFFVTALLSTIFCNLVIIKQVLLMMALKQECIVVYLASLAFSLRCLKLLEKLFTMSQNFLLY